MYIHVWLILDHIATVTATNVTDAKTSKQLKKGNKLYYCYIWTIITYKNNYNHTVGLLNL